MAFDAGDRVETVHDQVAAGAELDDHRVHVVLWSGQGSDRACLGERRDATDRVDDELPEHLAERRRDDRIAEAPAGHRKGLGKAVEDDRPLRHPGQRRDGHVLGTVVQDPAVDLVGQDPQVVADGELGDPLDIGPGQDAASRVGRRVDDQDPRPRRDQRRKLVHVEAEVIGHPDRDRHRRRADESRQGLIDGIARIRDQDLVARVHEPKDRVHHDALAAGGHEDLRGIDVEPLPGRGIGRDRRAQGGDTGERRVVRLALVECPLCGLPDVGRGIEVRLADLKVDDGAALGLQRASADG